MPIVNEAAGCCLDDRGHPIRHDSVELIGVDRSSSSERMEWPRSVGCNYVVVARSCG